MTHQTRASSQSPRFAQPATFMRLPPVEDATGLDVAIVGVPYDGGTSYRPGARLGPREFRAQSSLSLPILSRQSRRRSTGRGRSPRSSRRRLLFELVCVFARGADARGV
jgi:arginase family enzyme